MHRRILGDIENRILSGEWAPGYRIPFEVDLATHYGCSRMTVNKALTQLVRAGLIERRKRSGTFVRRPRAQSAVLEIHDIESEVASLGLPYSYSLERRTVGRATPVDEERLDLAAHAHAPARILRLVAVHRAGGNPFCLEERLINLAIVPEAETADFASGSSGRWLLRLVPWSDAEHRIQASGASDSVAAMLELSPGAACLVMERRTKNARGMVTWVRLTYPADSHTVVARFTPSSR